jgi:hypothetical protein
VPVLDLWRRLLGWKATAYLFPVFFAAMAIAAVGMEYLFSAAGWIPDRLTAARIEDLLAVKLDLTLVMTIVALLGTGALLYLRYKGPGAFACCRHLVSQTSAGRTSRLRTSRRHRHGARGGMPRARR